MWIKKLDFTEIEDVDGVIGLEAHGMKPTRYYIDDKTMDIKLRYRGGYRETIIEKQFDDLEEAKEFAQSHFENEVMQYLNVPEDAP